MKTHNLLLITLAIMLFSCQQIDTQVEAEILLETDKAFSDKSVAASPPEAFYEFLTEDALQLPAGDFPIIGREAIRDSMITGFNYELVWYPQYAEVAKCGNMGYTWGYYDFKIEGDERIRHGKYLNV